MIYTQFGVPVTVEAKTENGSHLYLKAADSDWAGWRDFTGLKADGGANEIQSAYENAPVREMPPEPAWKGRLRDALNN